MRIVSECSILEANDLADAFNIAQPDDEAIEPGGEGGMDGVAMLKASLDRFIAGMAKLESRFRQAVAKQETGTHVFEVTLDHGQVRKVSVQVREVL